MEINKQVMPDWITSVCLTREEERTVTALNYFSSWNATTRLLQTGSHPATQ